jgi:Ca2+-binding RTX toxin-like protein
MIGQASVVEGLGLEAIAPLPPSSTAATDNSVEQFLSPYRNHPSELLPGPSHTTPFIFTPTILAGDPNGNPPDSPDQRIDPNTKTSPFAGVGSVSVSRPGTGDFLGTGTPISRRHILTAAHLFDLVNDDGTNDVTPGDVIFNLNFGRLLSNRITAEAIQIFPGFRGFNATTENDLAIITLSSDLPEGVPIYGLNRQPLTQGTTITLVGYGTSGNGVTGQIPGTATFDQKRVGQNQVDLVTEGTFVYDFDGSNASTNLLSFVGSGPSLGNAIETTVGPGDSGGPSFIRNGDALLLTGVNTFAFSLPEGFSLPGGVQGVFGTGGGGVDVSDPAKLSWIDSVLATLPSKGSLTGTVWNDVNGDGQQTADESGLADWTVYLDLNQDGQLSPSEPTAITDASGNYGFTNLDTGFYTVADVAKPEFAQTFPSTQTVELLNADFSDANGASSLDGFTIDNTGAPVAGLWHLSTGRGNQAGHSVDDSLYFGQGEGPDGGGNYNVGHTAGRVTSQAIALPTVPNLTLSFNYFLNVEVPTDKDRVKVKISRNGGTFQIVAAKGDVLQSTLNPTWRAATIDLTPYAGSTVQVQFDFDTIDGTFNRFEGLYIDDVAIRGGSNGTHTVKVESGKTAAGINFGQQAIATPTPTPTPIPTPTPTPIPTPTPTPTPVNVIFGTDADDVLTGTAGADLVNAGSGNDTVAGWDGNDVLNGEAGLDRLLGNAGDDTLNGGADADRLIGGDGLDTVNGDAGNDVLFGDAGIDQLNGGTGDDVLIGGADEDVLTGGDGRDRFTYNTIDEGGDRIKDFNLADDVIVLKRIFDRAGFTSSSPFDDYVRLVQVGSKTVVKVDPDGDSGSDLFVRLAVLENVTATDLRASNFVV